MIPKRIHYCWFGGNAKSELILKCLNSWKEYAPDYEIIEWNESNFKISKYKYMKEAFENRRYAFVSDVARFDILHEYGGIYLDTDVELIKPISEFLQHDMFMGYDQRGLIASGLIFGSVKGHNILAKILEYYSSHHFIMKNGRENLTTVVTIVSDTLTELGFELNGQKIEKEGVVLYPKTFFDPYDYEHQKMMITEDTHAIHYYSGSWKSDAERRIYKIGLGLKKVFGETNYNKIVKVKHKIWG